jgi:uncharacterized protein YcbK (DUF882 family)
MREYATEHFKFSEFLVSSQHPELIKDYEMSFTELNNIQLLCESILEPVRKHIDMPMIVLSGKRTKELNDKVGGAKDSDHLYGIAADITCRDVKLLFNVIYLKKMPYRQLIYYTDKNFVHVSINLPGRKFKNEALLKHDGDPNYYPYTG